MAKNHTTGGNTGSPALDAFRHMEKRNFISSWENTISPKNEAPLIQRNKLAALCDVLFIIDRFAEAVHLVSNMKRIQKHQ